LAAARRSTAKPKPRSRKKSPASDRRWTWLVGGLLVLTAVVLGGLNWSQSDRGRAALLHLGADALYGTVQARVDSVLCLALPDHEVGSVAEVTAADAHDWPLVGQGDGAAVACRVVPVSGGGAWWQVQDRLDQAVRGVGARVLWGERLGRKRGAGRPDERRDVLRLDVGVPGRATHTLLLYRESTSRPEVRWGGDPAASAWRLLQASGDGPVVAIVLDDWGYGRNATTTGLLNLEIPLTMAVLPGLAYSRGYALEATDLALPPAGGGESGQAAEEAARRRRQAGSPVTLGLGREPGRLDPRRREIMLHLPMESVRYPEIDPGPDAILVGMNRLDMVAVVDKTLAALPNVRGVNNHQGSRATADQATMEALMSVLQGRDLFFLDSLTASGSVAYQTARSAGLRAARNRIFLDDDHKNENQIRERLQSLVRSARASGGAIGIGHPHPGTLAVLKRELPRLAADGVRFVTMSEYLALTGGPQ